MKKLVLVTSFILALGASLMAQDCATGYCPASITVHHRAGTVSPETVNITYEVIKTTGVFDNTTTPKCAIVRNLGASAQPGSVSDNTAAAAGWYWQFNRKQGYSYFTGSRVPSTTWITSISETSDWLPANDPCSLLLGSTWRLPTNAEWTYADGTYGGWTTYAGPYASILKLHAAGYLANTDGSLNYRSNIGNYWSSTQSSAVNANYLYIDVNYSYSNLYAKSYAASVRCIRTY